MLANFVPICHGCTVFHDLLNHVQDQPVNQVPCEVLAKLAKLVSLLQVGYVHTTVEYYVCRSYVRTYVRAAMLFQRSVDYKIVVRQCALRAVAEKGGFQLGFEDSTYLSKKSPE